MANRKGITTWTARLVANAAGTASATSPALKGMIRMITVEYDGSSAAGTDVVVSGTVKGGPGAGVTVTYLNLANANTSGAFFPHAFSESATGTDSATIYTAAFPVNNLIDIALTGQTENLGVTVTVFLE